MRLTNARHPDGRLLDVTIEDGRIAAFDPAGSAPRAEPDENADEPPPIISHDLAGALLLPALVDGHVHLDKTLMGMGWRPNSGAPNVAGRIENERTVRGGLALPVEARAEALLERMLAYGTTALRTHVDIDDVVGLSGFQAVMRVVEAWRGRIDIQVVAFPQSGILTRPGVADLLDAALHEGADLVGGLDPASIDGDAAGHLDVVFGLAGRHRRGIDIHLHDIGPGGNAQLRDIAARTKAADMGGIVTVSHAFSLGTADADDFAATADALAAAGVSILTSSPPAVPVPPVKALRARGVAIFAGSDNIRDLWNPFGNGDMLERAMLVCLRQGFRSDADIGVAFEICSDAGARVLGLPGRSLELGAVADLVAVPCENLAEAVAERPHRRQVFKGGRKLAG
jgi:cytosine deaminase